MHPKTLRLYAAIEKSIGRKLTGPTEVAGLLGLKTAQTAQNWEARGPSNAGILEANKRLGVQVAYVNDGSGAMLVDGGKEDGAACQIKQYDTGGAMGSGLILRDQPGVIKSWNVSQEWINKNVRSFSAANNLCIVTGFGDSMKPMFNPGDPLLVDMGVMAVEFDSVYFFRVGDEGFVKRLQRVPGLGIRVLSANRDNYEPWTITSDMDFQVLGRVLKVWKSEDF